MSGNNVRHLPNLMREEISLCQRVATYYENLHTANDLGTAD